MSEISLTASLFYCHPGGQFYCVMLNLLVFVLFYVMLNLFQHLHHETLKRVQGDRIEDWCK